MGDNDVIDVDEDQLAEYGRYIGAEASVTVPALEQFTIAEGMNTEGFSGVLAPLGTVIEGLPSEYLTKGFSLMQSKLTELGDGIIGAAQVYGATEAGNQSLFEINGLDDDPDVVAEGTGDYDQYSGNGAEFRLTDLDLDAPERSSEDYLENVDHGIVADILEWIWQNSPLQSLGESLFATILEPFLGKPTYIRANGEAWETIGGQFGNAAANIAMNFGNVVWVGGAQVGYSEFVAEYWENGASAVGEMIGGFIGEGFNKIAEVSEYLAGLAVSLIERIVRLASKSAFRAIPLAGWAFTAIEYIADYGASAIRGILDSPVGGILGGALDLVSSLPGVPDGLSIDNIRDALDFDIDTLHESIAAIVEMVPLVIDLIGQLETLVETISDYFDTAQELANTLEQIPDISSIGEAADLAAEIGENTGQMQEQLDDLEEATENAGDDLDDLDELRENNPEEDYKD